MFNGEKDSNILQLLRLLRSPLVALRLLESRNLPSDIVLQLPMQLRLVSDLEEHLKMNEEGSKDEG